MELIFGKTFTSTPMKLYRPYLYPTYSYYFTFKAQFQKLLVTPHNGVGFEITGYQHRRSPLEDVPDYLQATGGYLSITPYSVLTLEQKNDDWFLGSMSRKIRMNKLYSPFAFDKKKDKRSGSFDTRLFVSRAGFRLTQKFPDDDLHLKFNENGEVTGRIGRVLVSQSKFKSKEYIIRKRTINELLYCYPAFAMEYKYFSIKTIGAHTFLKFFPARILDEGFINVYVEMEKYESYGD